MHYRIEKQDTFSLGTVTNEEAAVTMAHISVDLHEQNSVEKEAVHHLYPDMLLAGAGTYNRTEFLHAVNIIGASISTDIADGILTITLRSTNTAFPKLLQLTETMLTRPTFSSYELQRVQATTSNALHTKHEDSKTIAYENLLNTLYGASDRRYTADIPQTLEAIKNTDKKQLVDLHHKVHTTFWTCTIAGNNMAQKNFSKLLTKLRKNTIVSHPVCKHDQKAPKPRIVLTDIPSRSNIDFSIGVPVPITLHHPDYVPLTFAIAVLAIPGFAGRLMNTVRDKEGLTYTIYGNTPGFSGNEQGYVRIQTFFTPEKSAQGLTSTYRELKKLYERGITAGELKTFKVIFETKQTLLQDSLLKQLSDLHAYNQHGFSVEEILLHKATVTNLTRKCVNEVIKKYLRPANFVVSGAGPVKTVKKDLERILKSVS